MPTVYDMRLSAIYPDALKSMFLAIEICETLENQASEPECSRALSQNMVEGEIKQLTIRVFFETSVSLDYQEFIRI